MSLISPQRLGRWGAVVLLALLGACSQDRPPVKGFVLPEGDAEQGKATFVALGCPQCHTVADANIVQPAEAPFRVQLGGEVLQVKHYGDLLTSIVNPNHRVSRLYRGEADGEASVSPMPDFTETITVAQLIDVVEFLHGKYEQLPRYSGRIYYYPP